MREKLIGYIPINAKRVAEYHKIDDFVPTQQLLERIVEDRPYEQIDLHRILQENRIASPLSEKRLKKYALVEALADTTFGIGPEDRWGETTVDANDAYGIFLDAPVGIVLTFQNKPNAIISCIAPDADTLFVVQKQGVIRKVYKDGICLGQRGARGLAPVNEDHLMMSIAEELARILEYERIGLLGYKNNHYTKPDEYDGFVRFPEMVARRKYDDIVQARGYTQDSDWNWHLTLKK